MQCVCLIYYKCNLMHMHFALDYLTSLCSFEKNMACIILKKQNTQFWVITNFDINIELLF